jgi:hypothetical protein
MLIPPGGESSNKVAALLAHRNMMFGARTYEGLDLQVCHKLIPVALEDCAKEGEQPQAIASLAGLCDYVQECLENHHNSRVLEALQATDRKGLEAVQAIATGVPREGHSVVGIGTYRDGEMGWKAIAKEFVELKRSPEVELYKKHGAQLVAIEHLADKNPDYLKTAGGAMARMFFL